MDLEVDQATPSAQAETIAVLGEALDDEYRALATYRAVIAKFGEIRPFSNIVEAEERHAQRLIGLFETQGQVPPADAWKDKVEAPASLEEALKTAVSAEVFNIEMYDRLLKRTQEETVVAALQQLQSASRRHLQAFRRHLNRRQ
ncbi:MAG: DUF2202 domain-containing protein [Planctomycetes bacterium]|nr:DUF2202 domain-containing protein [Planctomycetota bacterium]